MDDFQKGTGSREPSGKQSLRKKNAPAAKTTMSVTEMRRLLGLGKTDSYWLVHKHCFETVLVNGKMRIVLDSFEHWYSMQIKYRKVDGSPPGAALRETSYSVRDIAQMLRLTESTVYELIKREQIETITVDYWMRISKEVFDRWYASQSRYRTEADRERDAQIEEETVSMPQMAWLLGLHRKEVYAILSAKENRGCFQFVTVADRKRITKESFRQWLEGQDKYHVLTAEEREAKEAASVEKMELPQEPKNPNFYAVEEIGRFFGIHRSSVYRWIQDGEIPARRIGSAWRIPRREFDQWLSCRQQAKEG